MFETPIVIVGNVVTDPVHRRVGEQSVYRFRVASNSRRRTADGTWEHGDTLYASVSCWGRLVTGAAASLTKGDPVIVVGQVYTNEYEDRDGNPRNSVEVRASAVGPDLARCTAKIERLRRQDSAGDEPEEPEIDGAELDVDVDDAGPSAEGLPLTA
jgi:single-strand DNA-binding protein